MEATKTHSTTFKDLSISNKTLSYDSTDKTILTKEIEDLASKEKYSSSQGDSTEGKEDDAGDDGLEDGLMTQNDQQVSKVEPHASNQSSLMVIGEVQDTDKKIIMNSNQLILAGVSRHQGGVRKPGRRDLVKRREQNRVASQRYRERRKQRGEEISHVVTELHSLKQRVSEVDQAEERLADWEDEVRAREEMVTKRELHLLTQQREMEHLSAEASVTAAAEMVGPLAVHALLREVEASKQGLHARQAQELDMQVEDLRLLVQALAACEISSTSAHGFSPLQLNEACQIAVQCLLESDRRWRVEENELLGNMQHPRSSSDSALPLDEDPLPLQFTTLRSVFGLFPKSGIGNVFEGSMGGSRPILGWLETFQAIILPTPQQVASMTEVEEHLSKILAPYIRKRLLSCIHTLAPYCAFSELQRQEMLQQPSLEASLQQQMRKSICHFMESCCAPGFVSQVTLAHEIPDSITEIQRHVYDITGSALRMWFSFLNPQQKCKVILLLPRKMVAPTQMIDISPSICPFFLDLLLQMLNGKNPLQGTIASDNAFDLG